MTNPVFARIQQQLSEHDVVLYMKGSKTMPQCGFSALAAGILERLGVNVLDVDVLRDAEIRQGIKEFSDWPTIPQLYIKGEFVGGSDIMREMFESGELQELLKSKGVVQSHAA
ncbi:MAG: Grx4 family monothiol glutaredoxin [Alphaproteobacteria bacterium]|nr:MAG: Grx4 family monothiol glutaredoxin [Alphaproteobacteria bacterium]